MKYATFLAGNAEWVLHEGIGPEGKLLGSIKGPPTLIDFSMTNAAALWVCCTPDDSKGSFLQRIGLPGLAVEESVECKKRITAISASPDGQRIVAVAQISGQGPTLVIWDGEDWSALNNEVTPDVSSRVAWIDDQSLVFESIGRCLSVFELGTGKTTSGPKGQSPAAAPLVNRWYAVQEGRVNEFVVAGNIKDSGVSPSGFDFGVATSLRTTLDGEVVTSTEPRFWFGNRTYIQQRNQKRIPVQAEAHVVCAVLGPFESSTS